jgi:PncC family amidohydrolase
MHDPRLPAAKAAALLIARGERIAIAESSAGGLISAALLAVPGASAYYAGGGVIYSARAFKGLLNIDRQSLGDMRSSSEPYAALLAETIRTKHRVEWGLSETGAAGPTGNPYGDPAGHTCFAVSGPVSHSRTLRTQIGDRWTNMNWFAEAALELLIEALENAASKRS